VPCGASGTGDLVPQSGPATRSLGAVCDGHVVTPRSKVGDRATWTHTTSVPRGGRKGWERVAVRNVGTVIEIDKPGLRGARLVFDEPDPHTGATECSATHDELRTVEPRW